MSCSVKKRLNSWGANRSLAFYWTWRFILYMCEPTPYPYPEPEESSSYPLVLLRPTLTLSSHPWIGVWNNSFFQVSTPRPCTHFSSFHVLCVITISSIWLSEYLVRSINHGSTKYTIFSHVLLLPLSMWVTKLHSDIKQQQNYCSAYGIFI